MTSASHHFATYCSSTVLPVPKPPGTAAAEPRASGNSRSSTRWPVPSGTTSSRRSRKGRGRRTGHGSTNRTARSPTSITGVSSAIRPAAAARVSSPETPGGQSTRCSTAPAFATTPSTAPASTRVPTDTDADGVKLQTGSRADWDRLGESHTGASDRRRSNPSKTPPNRPGPRLAHLHHRVADPQAAGVLEGLHGDEVAVDADRLAGGAQRPHLDGVEHGHVVEPRRLDERAAHPDHPAGRRPAWVAHASHDRRICTAEASNARSASVGSEKSTRRTPSVATIPPSSGSPSTAADPRAARARSDRRASIRG